MKKTKIQKIKRNVIKMNGLRDFFDKMGKKSTLEICIVSDNKILDRFRLEDTGQNIAVSKKLNRAFIIPDRSDGLHYGFSTIFFYDAENSTPLIPRDKRDIDATNEIYCYGIYDDNKIKRVYNRIIKTPDKLERYDKNTKKSQPLQFKQTTIDNKLLKGLIDTKIVTDLIRSPENIFETLKIPIIIACICLTMVVIVISL